ncbi:MAG: T9SS type A sorting domain-containing protein, partial [Crocinitomicaceae bacterium]
VYRIYALTQEFGEGTSVPMSGGGGAGASPIAPDATWTDAMLGTASWTSPGGDYVPAQLSTVSMSNTGNQVFVSEPGFVATAQSWINTPASNFGIILIGDESAPCNSRRFGSKELGVAPVLSVTYSVPCVGPTAICQDIDVFLDASGNASISATDLDGGSTDDCSTGSLQFAASQTSFSCADVSSGSGGSGGLMITGVYDGPLTGGTPKGVELYAGSAIADLSNYGIGSANNGGGSDGEEFTFPSVAVPAGTFLYVTTDSALFNAFFGFDPDFVDGSMAINGDDAIELFQGGAVIDVFGDINVDGTGQPWEYQDGWAYRNNMQGTNAGVFTSTNWSYSGANALDGETSNSTAATPFPVASFLGGGAGVSVTLTVVDGLGNLDSCIAIVTVMDTIAPIPDLPQLSDLTSICPINPIAPTAMDNCGGSISGTTSSSFPITSSTTITWVFDDGNGNTTSQDQNVTVDGLELGVTIMAPSPTLMADATGVTYQWIDCSDNTPISGETSQSFTATVTGNYAVIIDNGTCSDTSMCVNVSLGGIEDQIDLGMTISPNPSTGIFKVSFENVVSGVINILDAKGRLIQAKELNGNTSIIDLTSVQSGLYFLNVLTEEGVSRTCLVKE